jgi:hypothetical protein
MDSAMKEQNDLPRLGPHRELSRTERIGWWLILLVGILWCGAIADASIPQAFRPYVAETDWKQAIWQYWRYSIDGAFPAGHLLTDFAFATHGPPVWWFLMATLSRVANPIIAANILHIAGFVLVVVATYFVVVRYAHHYLAVVAAVLVPRMPMYFIVASGGFARSFGMGVVMLLLAAWVWGRHRLVLLVLVLQAGLYPSAVIPCGLAYGAYHFVRAIVTREPRQLLEVIATGVVVVLIGYAYDHQAPTWWGSMMTLAEAQQNPAVQAGGRSTWVPMPTPASIFELTLTNPFRVHGEPLWRTMLSERNGRNLGMVYAVLVGIALLRRRIPIPVVAMFLSSAAGFFLARALAFKLYLPHRVLQHSYGALVIVTVSIALWVVATWVLRDRRHLAGTVAAFSLAIPIVVFAGVGTKEHRYRSYANDARLYQWIEKNTAVDAQFAGNYQILDEIPLFAKRQVFINWKMAHPFRAGYYKEVERRTLRMYEAYYATDWSAFLRFCDQEKIDFFVWNEKLYQTLERGDGQLFSPLRQRIEPLFQAGKGRFVVPSAPAKAVVFRHRTYRVIDVEKLRVALAANPPTNPAADSGSAAQKEAPEDPPEDLPDDAAANPEGEP